MRKGILLVTLLGCSWLASGAIITTSVSCAAPPGGTVTISGTDSCFYNYSGTLGNGNGKVSVRADYSSPPAGYNSPFTADVGGYASASPLSSSMEYGYADGTASLSLSLYTAGPVRTGTAVITVTGNVGSAEVIDANARGGGSVSGGNSLAVGCLPDVGCYLDNHISTEMIPFNLGVPFDLNLNGLVNAGDKRSLYSAENSSDFYIAIGISVSDANGLPVQIEEAPEPAFLLAPGFGLITLLVWYQRRPSRLA